MKKFRRVVYIYVLFVLFYNSVIPVTANNYKSDPIFSSTERPWVWWFWMGNIVSEKDLDQQLESFHRSGFGGVTIISTYGVKGFEQVQIPFRSIKWYQMIAYTIKKAKTLDMGVDLAFTSAWPYGGPSVTKEMGAKMIKRFKSFNISGGTFTTPVIAINENEFIIAISAISDQNDFIDLTSSVSHEGIFTATLPQGNWVLNVLVGANTEQQVKRSSPGGEGLVLDPFNPSATETYMHGFDTALKSLQGIRSAFNDSYEIYGADFTPNLMNEFEKRRGYSLKPYIQFLMDTVPSEIRQRIICDYRETIADLLLNGFMNQWVKWSNDNKIKTTEQAHGSPGNLLDLYGAADIPQTESFGPSHLNIPGVRTDKDIKRDRYKWPDKLMFKFSSSAAHVNGRLLCSSETATWLTNHFRMALSQLKPQVDELFIAGINHIMLISATNVPTRVPFPGWLFYPAPDFGFYAPFYNYLPDFSNYVARCQHLLQNTQPDNEILVYFPIYDYWSEAKKDLGVLATFDHVPTKWGDQFPFSLTIRSLWKNGFSFDYISDKQIQQLKATDHLIITPGKNKYKVILIPDCKRISINTYGKLLELAREGVPIVFEKQIPNDVPGWNQLNKRLALLATEQKALQALTNVHVSKDITHTLQELGCSKEEFYSKGLEFIRKSDATGKLYYIANLDSMFKSGLIKIGTDFKSIETYDPLTGISSSPVIEQKGAEKYVFLQLLPGQSCFLKTNKASSLPLSPCTYFDTAKSYPLQTTWHISFEKSPQFNPAPIQTKQLVSWTETTDSAAQYFSGTARYDAKFDLPASLNNSKVIRMDMADLREMAEVYLNGQFIGKSWCVPYILDIKKSYFKVKNNQLSIRVTNLSTNRVIWMDRHKIPWKTFYIADPVKSEFDASDWQLQPSGIIGTIRLTGNK